MTSTDSGVSVLGALAAYNIVQNLVISERAYVPVNLATTAGLVVFGRRSGISLDDMGLSRERMREGLLVGGAVGAAVGAAALAAGSDRRFASWFLDERAQGHRRGQVVYRVAVRFPLGTALFEEIAFRGVLDGLWRRSSGVRAARLTTAMAFGAWHLIPTFRFYPEMGAARGSVPSVEERGAAALWGAILTGASGLGFTALRERTGSVAAPWFVHAAINTVSYLAARRAWRAVGG